MRGLNNDQTFNEQPPYMMGRYLHTCCGFLESRVEYISFSVLSFFFPHQLPSMSFCTVFDPVSSNIDKFLLVNFPANVEAVGAVIIYGKDWLTYPCGTDRTFDRSLL